MMKTMIMEEEFGSFLNRIETTFGKNIDSIPAKWIISDGLRDKVMDDGHFSPFYGYTSVYRLSEEDAAKCSAIQRALFSSHISMFVPLPISTFHLTAHEFCNEYTVSHSPAEIDEEERRIEDKIRNLFSLLHREYGGRIIRLKALGPSTNGNDVVSIKFVPLTASDSSILQHIFSESEKIWPVGRYYTPHVSLGYFRTEQFSRESVTALYDDIRKEAEKTDFTISFSVDDLVYQRHYDMQDFRKIFSVSEV